jgi:ubiquinone/menaquinone biosynthesis C-methylase UbiE
MYDRVFEHVSMLGDRVRMDGYQDAIRKVVRTGDVVADIGTGSGILAFLAARAGARRVYAVEKGEIIEEAQRLAQLNGLADKIVFMKGRSDRIELPERADVVVSEIVGYFGLDENVHWYKIDARERFLKPGGRLIPSWLELCVAPIESEVMWRELIGLWTKDFYGLDFSPVRSRAVAQGYVRDCSKKVTPLAPPATIANLDFYRIERMPSVFRGQCVVQRAGSFHGLIGFFRVGLAPDVVLSTAPEDPSTHWHQTFFPLQEEVLVATGDVVRFELRAISLDTIVYWEWSTEVHRNEAKLAEFTQSALRLSRKDLLLGRASFKPALTPEGEIRRRILDLCDGQRSLGEISELLRTEFPLRFAGPKEAMQETAKTVRAFTRTV